MDNRANLHESLFSRNSTPPTQQHPFSQHIANNSAPNLIDSLFQNISAPAAQDSHSIDIYTESASIAPALSLPDDPVTSPGSVAERQNALLSLIGTGPSSTTNRPAPLPQPSQQQPQQVPTPPGSSSRSNASPPQIETQQILEQMIGGTARSSNSSDTQRNNPQQQPIPSPPYPQREEFRPYNQYEQSSDTSPRARAIQNPLPPPQPQPQIQPPSPRRSMFEFTSAFDHLSSTGSLKKKPVPPQPSSISSGNDESSSWSSVNDPKRQTVENLLENLTRGQPQQLPATLQPQPPAYEAYLSGSDFSQVEPVSSRAPLPQIPGVKPAAVPARNASPLNASPKSQALHRPQPRAAEITTQPAQYNQQPPFVSGHPLPPGGRNEKDNSPGPRGTNNARQKAGPPPQSKFTNIKQISPGPQSQVVNFDVSQALEEIQARESVKWTPIALVKQDSVFLPGSTIGATHWVAYAMTRGRVRVISRSSGDRTLLQLPSVFSLTASVIDMAVFGNRLAGVTSDGGFVVWELPELITDDVPGRLLLCVPPTHDSHDAIRSVKWHPKEVDTLAITTEDRIYVIDLANTHALHGQPLPHSDLHHIGQVFNVPSPVVAFDFDVVHYALATISDDSTLTIWNMHDSQPYTVHKIRGDDAPSSLTFVDGGVVVGRKNGTVFQLLSMSDKAVLSTISFANGLQDDPDMFGHISYDTRIQTLWVANSRRESLIALKVHMETSFAGGEENIRGYVEQVVEFSGIKPTIHFVILTVDADPHGDEAHAACVAAKIVPGELALVGFSVHSTGVDQVLIRKEWFDSALAHADSKFPGSMTSNAGVSLPENKAQRQPLPPLPANLPQSHSNSISFPPPRARTPPSDDVDNEFSDGRHPDQKGKGSKAGKAVNWKEKEDIGKREDKNAKLSDSSLINDSQLGQALSREIKKTEESLHSRIGKLIGKEMDKQHQRFEETRLHEQAEDFARQEKILKLISTELTRNTTRVVEMAVKSEVQTSVLPSLENITRNEVRAALHEQVELGLLDNITKGLPNEMEKLLLRPNISGHFANILTSALTPMIERHIKEILTTSFFQFHSQQSASMHQELMRELRGEISTIKTELGNWHNEALRGQETTIRELERTVRALSEQVKFLTINAPPPPSSLHHIPQPQPPQSTSAGPSNAPQAATSHLRQVNIPLPNPPVPTYVQSHPTFQQASPPQPPIHQQWYTSIAAPQASHPATIPQAPAPAAQQERTPPVKTDQWDENYLGVLHSQDPIKLRDLLSRTNPDLVLPLNAPPLVSQAVILTLIHRLSAIVGETAPTDENFKTSLWWLQRVASHLRPDDKLISDFIPRVIPTVQQSLNTTKQRLAILPGGPGTMETARALSDIQEGLRRKVSQ